MRRSIAAFTAALCFTLVGCGTQSGAAPAEPAAVTVDSTIYLGGVLRNDGAGWHVLNDAGHRPTGITGVTQYATKLEVAHAVGAVQVSSVQVTPDEYYQARGYRVGASVGLTKTVLFIYKGTSTTPVDPATLDSASGNFWFTGFLLAN